MNREDVFVAGTDGAMWQKTWTAANGWTTTWASLGGQLTSSPAPTTERFSIEVWVRWSDGGIYLREYYSGAWHNWGGPAEGPP
jgi:hypothetical protein